MKLENEGVEMIALTSKTYILDTDLGKYKTAAKGAQKSINLLTIEKYKKALFNNVKVTHTNKSFDMRDTRMLTYEQDKTILSSEYSKKLQLIMCIPDHICFWN